MNVIKQFEALFDAATIAGVVTNARSAIINFNKKAESNFGYRGGTIIGKQVEVLFSRIIKTKTDITVKVL